MCLVVRGGWRRLSERRRVGCIQHANAFTLRLAYSNYTAKEQHEAAKKPTKHSKTI